MGNRQRASADAIDAVLRALGAPDQAPPRVGSKAGARPLQCHLQADLLTWGWVAQLYSLRSRNSWGIGDLHDLRRAGSWMRRHGAGVVMINPLHAALPGLPQEPSPYFPSSRMFRNPLYLCIEEIPGAAREPLVEQLAQHGRALNAAPVIDRDRIYELKLRALEALYDRFSGDSAFERFCESEGETLERYAVFCVLAEKLRRDWTQWQSLYRTPAARGVTQTLQSERARVDFHRWCQWQLDVQLQRAAGEMPLIFDLAVGFSPDGADAWMWQDVVAADARVGAPPDEFAPHGQDWGLPPFHPHRLRAARYRPFRETVQRAMRHARGIRIDHVMGLFRLWWIPRSVASAADGAYVRYPADDLLDIVAEESRRARCFVVGEDLGTVDPAMRQTLRSRRMLSYRLAWFENRPPLRYPKEAFAAISTHDLPTIAGVWSGADLAELRQTGRAVNEPAERALRRRLQRLAAVAEDASLPVVVERAYAHLAQAPSRIVCATLEDAAAALRRPNVPGAVGRDNWSIALPRTLEQLQRDALPRRIALGLRAAHA